MRKILGLAFILLILTGIILARAPALNKKAPKILVVYYSHSGNTRAIASLIRDLTGGDVYEIQTVTPYPAEYKVIVEQIKKEKSSGVKPKIKSDFAGGQNYDLVFIGSPCWFGTIATPVETFLSTQDFSGKTLIPFITYGGSGLGRAVRDIRALQPSANVASGKAFPRSGVQDAQKEVADWLASWL